MTHPLTRLPTTPPVRYEARKSNAMPAPPQKPTPQPNAVITVGNDLGFPELRSHWNTAGEQLVERDDDDGDVCEKQGTARALKLLSRCRAYLDWCFDVPRMSEKILGDAKRGPQRVPVFHKRSPTYNGLYAAVGVGSTKWAEYLAAESPVGRVARFVDNCIRDEKLTGSHSGEYSQGLTARELGLTDKVETHTTGTVTVTATDPNEFADRPNLTHPNDPDPENATILFTASQLAAGVPYPIRTVIDTDT